MLGYDLIEFLGLIFSGVGAIAATKAIFESRDGAPKKEKLALRHGPDS